MQPLALRLLALVGGHEAGFIDTFNKQKIKEAKTEKSDVPENDPMTMVRKMILAQRAPEGAKGITDMDMETTCGANVAAGSDTTSLTLSAVLFYLYRNPVCLERVRKEISDAGLDSSAQFYFRDVQSLPYLQAAIKEALRIHPGVGLPLWRQVPPGGLSLCGQFFPEGVCIFIRQIGANAN
jgi:cytochrome P450